MTIVENAQTEELPVDVRAHPHWRVVYRPLTYEENRIASLSECLETVSKNRVRLRGWDFPHIPPRNDELGYGSTWVAAWSDFMGHVEYWRFYQSTQFVYLGTIREITDHEWADKLRRTQHFIDRRDLSSAPGFISITNFVYNVTEIFEFVARLAQAGVYREPIEIAIRLNDIQGVVLAADPDRMWPNAYSASQPELQFKETVTPAELVAAAAEHAVSCVVYFFERFGWLKPNVEVIRMDQQKLLTRRL